ncbi:hypothetical protein EDB92DRAFT_1948109 [Lactarius akahatsu]|uniref:Uncharacterized protein n=1 Tax=Lactarius akahatsu TaxID=416441 RepID=A0AAD4QBX8_9AGAM|nr:hypothetical protein EDB92DRAFT_1948109 [Lactarius akahatsu]
MDLIPVSQKIIVRSSGALVAKPAASGGSRANGPPLTAAVGQLKASASATEQHVLDTMEVDDRDTEAHVSVATGPAEQQPAPKARQSACSLACAPAQLILPDLATICAAFHAMASSPLCCCLIALLQALTLPLAFSIATHLHPLIVRLTWALGPKSYIFSIFDLGPVLHGLLPFQIRVLTVSRFAINLSPSLSSRSLPPSFYFCRPWTAVTRTHPARGSQAVHRQAAHPHVLCRFVLQLPISVTPPTSHIPFKMSRSSYCCPLATCKMLSEPVLDSAPPLDSEQGHIICTLIVDSLLDAGTDPCIKDKEGHIAQDYESISKSDIAEDYDNNNDFGGSGLDDEE